MSDRPIQVGDLVQVVRSACHCPLPDETIGVLFVVHDMGVSDSECADCGKILGVVPWAQAIDDEKSYELCRLKRIPPLSELEGQRTQEDLREPA